MAMGQALNAPIDLLADALPVIEVALLNAVSDASDPTGEMPDDHD